MFEKLSSYNLLTNLVPGAVLSAALNAAGNWSTAAQKHRGKNEHC